MSDEDLKTDGPRGDEIRRRLKAVGVLRARAEKAPSDEQRKQCLRDADRLLDDARTMARDDETAAEFAEEMKRNGGVYWPSGGEGGSGGFLS